MTRSKGGGTYWWVAPSSLFLAVGTGVASSLLSVLVVVRSCRRSLLSVVRCCPSFAAVRLRSCPSRVVKSFASLALRLAMGVVNGGVVVLVEWACVQLWPVVHVGGFRGCSLSFACCCVLCASLLPLLGGCRVVLGGCSRFWTLGTV